MEIAFKSSNPPIDKAALEHFQRQWELSLPQCYKDFLLSHNGGRPVKSIFPITGFSEGTIDSIQVFFGLNTTVTTSDLSWRIRNRIPQFPDGLLEVACTDGSDLICIDIKSKEVPVYFLDHRPSWGNGVWKDEALYLVATTFFEFLAQLEEKRKKVE